MKKITLWLFALFLSWQIHAQVGIAHSFDTSLPTSVTQTGGFIFTSVLPCSGGGAIRKNLYSTSAVSSLVTATATANNTDAVVSFKWRTIEYGVATGVGLSGDVQYSVDNGVTYTTFGSPITSSTVQSCQNWTATIPAASIPNGSSFKLKINANWVSGDFYIYVDDLSILQTSDVVPSCATITSPANGAINVTNAVINWTFPAGIPTGYKLSVGTTSGDTDIMNMVDIGNVFAYTLLGLDPDTTYFVKLTPYNVLGNALDCTEISFTTCGENTSLAENFDSYPAGATAILPTCWSNQGTSGASYATTGSVAPASPANRWYLYAASNTVAYAHTPIFSNLSENTHRLRFKSFSSTANKTLSIGYLATQGDVSSFVLLQDINLGALTTGASIQEFAVIPGALPAGVSKLVFRNNSQNAVIYFDDVFWEPIPAIEPTCVSIVSPANNATNVASSTISWTYSLNATGYKLSIGTSAGDTSVLNMQEVGNVTSYTFASDPGTTYFVTVYPFNAFGQPTGCTEISFTTCDENDSLAENFDTSPTGTTAILPTCWTKDGTTGSSYVTTGSVSPASPANRWYLYAAATTVAYAHTPLLNNLAANTHRLRFKAYSTTANKNLSIGYLTIPGNLSTFVLLQDINLGASTTAASIQEYSVIPGALPAGVSKLVFKNNSQAASFYFDDVFWEPIPATAPTCVAITSPLNAAINVSSSVITWNVSVDATSYKLSVGTTSGDTSILNLQDVGNVTSYNLATDPGTTYFVTVFPHNVNGTASGCTEISFTTCDENDSLAENFDSSPTGTTAALPTCWSREGTTGSSYVTTGSVAPATPANRWYLYAATTSVAYAHTPLLNNLAANTHRLRFKAYSATANKNLSIGYLTTPGDVSTFVLLQDLNLGALTTAASIQEYAVVPGALPAGVSKLVFKNNAQGATFYFDDVFWEPIPTTPPTCSAITSPTNGAENVMSTRVAWASNADATGYKISVGETAGGTEVLNMQDVGNVLSYTFASDPGTSYHVTVYPYNANGTATGCTEISFTTCDALDAPFIEPFATFLPACWQAADNGNLTAGPETYGTSSWIADGFANNGTTGAIRYNVWMAVANDWIISPVVNIPATGYELKFDAAVTQYNVANGAPVTPWESDDKVEILVSTSGTSNWTVLKTFDNTNTPAPAGEVTIIDLDTYGGQMVRFAIRAVEGVDNGLADLDFILDNFEVRLTPATAPVCPTNVVATANPCGNFSNAITWEVSPGADGYKVSVGTSAGGTQIANNVDLGNVLTYSFTGVVGTEYFYTIVAYNAFGISTCSEMSFTTSASGCYCVSNPTSNDGLGITNAQVVSTNFPTGDVTYFNHTATPVDMEQGVTANVAISFATGYTYNTYVLIDFNDDLDFADAGEVVYSGESLATNPTVLNTSFMMPMTAPVGAHRMRIVTADIMATVNPCYNDTYGVTLDFTVNVTASLSSTDFDAASFKAYPNPVKDVFTIAYASDISNVRVTNLLGQEVYSEKINATSTQIDMSQLSAGAYIVTVTIGDTVKTIKVVKQ